MSRLFFRGKRRPSQFPARVKIIARRDVIDKGRTVPLLDEHLVCMIREHGGVGLEIARPSGAETKNIGH